MILYLVIKCISLWRNIFLCSMLHLLYEDIKIYCYHYIIINKKNCWKLFRKRNPILILTKIYRKEHYFEKERI